MHTMAEFAAYVEKGDTIRHLEHGDLYVKAEPEDHGDMIRFTCNDEEGFTVRLAVPPFSHVDIVTSYED